MKKNSALIALLISSLAASAASACGIVVLKTFRDDLQAANSVYVFRVDSLRLVQKTEEDWPSFEGRVTVIDTIHGSQPSFRKISVDGICSDIRLRVGNLYLSATSQTGQTLLVDTMDTSLVDVSREYYFGRASKDVPSPTIDAVRAYYRGNPLPVDFPDPKVVSPVHF